jgi:hypothetical protein
MNRPKTTEILTVREVRAALIYSIQSIFFALVKAWFKTSI